MKKIISLILILATLFALAMPANAASYYTYTDKASGNQLTIPYAWDLESGDSELAKVEFVYEDGGTLIMTYGSRDFYSNLDANTRNSFSRSEVNNSLFTEADIAEVLGVNPSEVTRVKVSGTEYFLARTVTRTTYQGTNLAIDTHYFLRIDNGWMYLFQYLGNVDCETYDDFIGIIASCTYGKSTSSGSGSSSSSQKSVYNQAVNAYRSGKYADAYELFSQVAGYENAADYMRLIRIRTYGDNIGIGCVYDYSKGLTDSQKAEIDAAARNFYFEDTAEVLMCNTDVATYYLFGNWNTASNAPAYSYLRWHKDSAGGYYYTRSNNVSTLTSDCVSINDGYVRISITSSNTLVFHIKLTGPNSMSLYCYEYDKCVELFRQ